MNTNSVLNSCNFERDELWDDHRFVIVDLLRELQRLKERKKEIMRKIVKYLVVNNKKSQTQHGLMYILIFFLSIFIIIFTHIGTKKLDIIIDNQETIINIQADNRAEIEEIKDFWQGDNMTRKKKKINLKDKSWKKEK